MAARTALSKLGHRSSNIVKRYRQGLDKRKYIKD